MKKPEPNNNRRKPLQRAGKLTDGNPLRGRKNGKDRERKKSSILKSVQDIVILFTGSRMLVSTPGG
jgi:hypothetical protein